MFLVKNGLRRNSLILACLLVQKEGGFTIYFRLRNNLNSSCSVTYSNPASIRAVDSLTLVAVLQVYSSS